MVRYSLFLRLLGMLTSVTSIVPLGLLRLRPFQVWTNGLHLDLRLHGSKKVSVSSQCLLALQPWRRRAFLAKGVALGSIPSRHEVVVTDASLSGWGAVWQHRAVRGLWSAPHRTQHINVLELRAIYLALNQFLPYLRGRHVLVRCDNKSAVYNVNHQGGTRSAQSLQVAQQPLVLCSPSLFQPQGYEPSRATEHGGRLSFTPETSVGGVATPPRGSRGNLEQIRHSRGRPVCFRVHNTLPSLVLSVGDESDGTGCLGTSMATSTPLFLPAISTDRVNSTQSSEGEPQTLAGCPKLLDGDPWCLSKRRDLLSQLGGHIWHPRPECLQLWVWPLRGLIHL